MVANKSDGLASPTINASVFISYDAGQYLPAADVELLVAYDHGVGRYVVDVSSVLEGKHGYQFNSNFEDSIDGFTLLYHVYDVKVNFSLAGVSLASQTQKVLFGSYGNNNTPIMPGRFLTQKPNGFLLNENEDELLSFIISDANVAQVKTKKIFGNGYEEVSTQYNANLLPNVVYQVGAGLNQLVADLGADSDLIAVEISVVDVQGLTLVAPRKYLIGSNPSPNETRVVFLNRYGVPELLTLRGSVQIKNNSENTSVWVGNRLSSQSRKQTRVWAIGSGPINQVMINYLQSGLSFAKKVWLSDGGIWVEVTLTSNDLEYYDSNNDYGQVSYEFTESKRASW
jgi:hypothetical protein